jgi:hypothetical protein
MRVIACTEDPGVIAKIPPTWTRKGLRPGSRGGHRAERHRSGDCSTDSGHLMSTTLVRGASGAATVVAGLGVGKCQKVRWRITCGRHRRMYGVAHRAPAYSALFESVAGTRPTKR